ncbi:g764 [Coccomyxa viridis]|uniref:G764 protein n=1 Tax=Coccomyxa viridis TaxID=1274662 RepID=A0ABP1FGH3_9CHLO
MTSPYGFLPGPHENNEFLTTLTFSDGQEWQLRNTSEKLAEHLNATSGKVITRFPPEPNGHLHIGHAKAMFVNFGLAESANGDCLLRFDDTNPETERAEFVDSINDIVCWLGYKPSQVTYTSDHFPALYEFATKLIRAGDAYVCHQTAEEINQSRKEKRPSPWRDRPIAESLKLFDDMKNGLIKEGAATLRLHMDPWNDNPNMADLIAYRIKSVDHPRTKAEWRIYPSYDCAHSLVDASENITHSLCTLEFEARRASYYWLLHGAEQVD